MVGLEGPSAHPRIADIGVLIRNDRLGAILLRKSGATDRVGHLLGATALTRRPRRFLRNSNSTRCTEPVPVAAARPGLRAAAGSERWRPEQIHPGRLVDHAVE